MHDVETQSALTKSACALSPKAPTRVAPRDVLSAADFQTKRLRAEITRGKLPVGPPCLGGFSPHPRSR